MFYFPCHIWDVILPIDKLIFFKMLIAPPTSKTTIFPYFPINIPKIAGKLMFMPPKKYGNGGGSIPSQFKHVVFQTVRGSSQGPSPALFVWATWRFEKETRGFANKVVDVAAIARSCKDIVLSCVAVGCSYFENILVLMGQTWIVPWPMMIEPWLELVKPIILFGHFKTHSHVYMYTQWHKFSQLLRLKVLWLISTSKYLQSQWFKSVIILVTPVFQWCFQKMPTCQPPHTARPQL